YLDGEWRQLNENEGNYMIRAIVNYDTEVPVLTSPSDGLVTTENHVTIEGNSTPNTDIHIYNNGEEVAVVQSDNEGLFSETLTLSEDKNVFTAKANYGNLLTHPSNAITVIKDTTAPVITILSPVDGDKLNTESITVTGQIEDDSLDEVLVNGEEATVTEDGSFEHTITVSEGENIITVTAKDLAGNESTESITVYIDFTAPIIENVLPNEDVYLMQGESVTVQFESE